MYSLSPSYSTTSNQARIGDRGQWTIASSTYPNLARYSCGQSRPAQKIMRQPWLYRAMDAMFPWALTVSSSSSTAFAIVDSCDYVSCLTSSAMIRVCLALTRCFIAAHLHSPALSCFALSATDF